MIPLLQANDDGLYVDGGTVLWVLLVVLIVLLARWSASLRTAAVMPFWV